LFLARFEQDAKEQEEKRKEEEVGARWIGPNIMDLVSLETRIRNRTFQPQARGKWKRHKASISLLQSHLVQLIVVLLTFKH